MAVEKQKVVKGRTGLVSGLPAPAGEGGGVSRPAPAPWRCRECPPTGH